MWYHRKAKKKLIKDNNGPFCERSDRFLDNDVFYLASNSCTKSTKSDGHRLRIRKHPWCKLGRCNRKSLGNSLMTDELQLVVGIYVRCCVWWWIIKTIGGNWKKGKTTCDNDAWITKSLTGQDSSLHLVCMLSLSGSELAVLAFKALYVSAIGDCHGRERWAVQAFPVLNNRSPDADCRLSGAKSPYVWRYEEKSPSWMKFNPYCWHQFLFTWTYLFSLSKDVNGYQHTICCVVWKGEDIAGPARIMRPWISASSLTFRRSQKQSWCSVHEWELGRCGYREAFDLMMCYHSIGVERGTVLRRPSPFVFIHAQILNWRRDRGGCSHERSADAISFKKSLKGSLARRGIWRNDNWRSLLEWCTGKAKGWWKATIILILGRAMLPHSRGKLTFLWAKDCNCVCVMARHCRTEFDSLLHGSTLHGNPIFRSS